MGRGADHPRSNQTAKCKIFQTCQGGMINGMGVRASGKGDTSLQPVTPISVSPTFDTPGTEIRFFGARSKVPFERRSSGPADPEQMIARAPLRMKAVPSGAAVLIRNPLCELRRNSRDSADTNHPASAVARWLRQFTNFLSLTPVGYTAVKDQGDDEPVPRATRLALPLKMQLPISYQ